MLGKDLYSNVVDGFVTTTNIDLGKNSIQGQLALGYMHKLSDKFSIGVGIGKQLGQGPTLNNVLNSSSTLTGDTNTVARQWKMHPGWSLALKPSMNLGNDSMVFIKLAKHWASGTFYDRSGKNCADTVNATGCESPSSDSFSANTNGTGIGAGLQTHLTEKLFLMIEVERIDYRAITHTFEGPSLNYLHTDSLKPKSITGTISLGYWF
jgi:opacity protein-like surface antigen